jgi:hypothetical protein
VSQQDTSIGAEVDEVSQQDTSIGAEVDEVSQQDTSIGVWETVNILYIK